MGESSERSGPELFHPSIARLNLLPLGGGPQDRKNYKGGNEHAATSNQSGVPGGIPGAGSGNPVLRTGPLAASGRSGQSGPRCLDDDRIPVHLLTDHEHGAVVLPRDRRYVGTFGRKEGRLGCGRPPLQQSGGRGNQAVAGRPKALLTPAQMAEVERWFAKGLNPQINQLLQASAKSPR